MRTAVIVEVHSDGHRCNDFVYACEDPVFQQFILHCVVYALGLCVVLGVA
jgi:hypothetical protein